MLFADVAAAREELGLPADAEALSYEDLLNQELESGDPELELLNAVAPALTPLGLAPKGFEVDPVTDAFDDVAISAAITGGTKTTITAIRTSQGFDELADALASEGFERDGNTLTGPDGGIAEVVDAGDGVILVSKDPGAAAEADAAPAGGAQDALRLLEGADQPIALAFGGFGSCVVAYGGWENAAGTEGTLAFEVDEPAEPANIETEAILAVDAEFGEPAVDGSSVEIPFTAESDQGPLVVRDVITVTYGDLYDCGE